MRLAKRQTYRIFRVTDKVQSQHVWITNIPLHIVLGVCFMYRCAVCRGTPGSEAGREGLGNLH